MDRDLVALMNAPQEEKNLVYTLVGIGEIYDSIVSGRITGREYKSLRKNIDFYGEGLKLYRDLPRSHWIRQGFPDAEKWYKTVVSYVLAKPKRTRRVT